MPINLLELLHSNEATNGTRALLEEIRKHQKDMPVEVRNDATFGALVVLYDLGKARAKRVLRLERFSAVYGLILALLFVLEVALHAEVPWLIDLVKHIFSG